MGQKYQIIARKLEPNCDKIYGPFSLTKFHVLKSKEVNKNLYLTSGWLEANRAHIWKSLLTNMDFN